MHRKTCINTLSGPNVSTFNFATVSFTNKTPMASIKPHHSSQTTITTAARSAVTMTAGFLSDEFLATCCTYSLVLPCHLRWHVLSHHRVRRTLLRPNFSSPLQPKHHTAVAGKQTTPGVGLYDAVYTRRGSSFCLLLQSAGADHPSWRGPFQMAPALSLGLSPSSGSISAPGAAFRGTDRHT